MVDNDLTKPPEKGPGDILLDLTKTALAPVPCIGGLAIQFLNAIVVPPIQQRYVEWVTSIAERLVALEREVEDFRRADLEGDESCADSFARASQTVFSSHQKEKLEALRNAVLNSALRNRPEDDIRTMFLNYVDVLTPQHFIILKFLDDPHTWRREHKIKLPENYREGYGILPNILYMCHSAFPELNDRGGFLFQIINDLENRGLIYAFRDDHTESGSRIYCESNISDMGVLFLAFISKPSTTQ